MSSNVVSLPTTDPTTISGSSVDVSSSTLPTSVTAPSGLAVETDGDITEAVEHQPTQQFATFPATVDVPIIQPALPENPHLRSQHPSQSAMAPDTPSHQLMSGLSDACDPNTAQPFNQHLGHQRAASVQPLGQDAMRVMPQSAPLPGLNLLMGRMADNQNNWSAGFSQAPDYIQPSPYVVQDQQAFSQQYTGQTYEIVYVMDPNHAAGNEDSSSARQPVSGPSFLLSPSPSQSQTAVPLGQQLSSMDLDRDSTLVYDQSGQLLSMHYQGSSQQPTAQQSSADVPMRGDVSSSPLQQAVSSSTITSGSPLTHVQGDQVCKYQRDLSQFPHLHSFAGPYQQPFGAGKVPSGFPAAQQRVLSPNQPLPSRRATSQLLGEDKDLTSLTVGDSFASTTQKLDQQPIPRVPPPGLSATGGYVWPESQDGQPWAIEHGLSNTVVDNFQQQPINVNEQTIPGPAVTCSTSGLVPGAATPNLPKKPIFGFATTSEAENFQSEPSKKSAFGMQVIHGLPAAPCQGPQHSGQGYEGSEPTRERNPFGLPIAGKGRRIVPAVPFLRHLPASKSEVKPEKCSPAPLGNVVAGGNDSDLSAKVWSQFAPYSASLSDVREQTNFGSSKGSSNNGGFSQVFLGNLPLDLLEPGEAVDPNRYSSIDDSLSKVNTQSPGSSSEPLKMEKIAVELLSSHQVLFIFHVLSIMARLRPEFIFKRDGENLTKIGVKLTLWGHTVVIAPSQSSVAEANIAACRRALEMISKTNPEWLVPPQPIDGPTTPDWNWIWMLNDYCMERAWPQPLYRPSSNGNLWHCDTSVKDKLFRTVRECRSLGEAQNTAAHTALYQLMVIESEDVLPGSFPVVSAIFSTTVTASTPKPVQESIQKQCTQILRSGKPLQPKKAARGYAGVTKSVPPPVMSKRARKRFNANLRQREAENQNQNQHQYHPKPQTQSHPQPQPANRLPPPSPPPFVARASNMIPLANCRLAPLRETEKPTEDPLAKLKSVENELNLLSTRASFRRIMEKICDVLGAKYPRVIREKKPGNHPHVYQMFAKFDSSHPYLSRASPIKLTDVENPDPEIAEEIAVKHVILHMLRMAKEDANVSDKTYKDQLSGLHRIEGETKDCLDRQSRPSGVLSY